MASRSEHSNTFLILLHLKHWTMTNDETLLPMRLVDYQFGSDDYEAYIRHRAQFLTSLRGRAALLRGGIVARIAREHIAIDSALLGPSSAMMYIVWECMSRMGDWNSGMTISRKTKLGLSLRCSSMFYRYVIWELYMKWKIITIFFQVRASKLWTMLQEGPNAKLEPFIAGIIFYSDATHLTSFGTASLYPMYMYVGNQSQYTHAKPSEFTAHHIAYIPKVFQNLLVCSLSNK